MRKWLTVEAGYYTVAMLPDGGMRKEGQTSSFAKMDQTEFSDLYRAVFRGLLALCAEQAVCHRG